MLQRISLLLLLMSIISCSNVSEEELATLAKEGRIQDNAPTNANAAIMLKVPIEVAWNRITEIKLWPDWFNKVSDVKLRGRLNEGREFSWKSGKTEIHSKIVVYKPMETIAWVGESWGIRTIHIWHLEKIDENKTIVSVKESMDGNFFLLWFYTSSDLRAFLQSWLTSLDKSLGSPNAIDF